MHNYEVKNLESAEFITEEVMRSPTRTQTTATKSIHFNYTKDAVQHIRRTDLLYDLCAGSGPDCLDQVKLLLKNDPKKNMREVHDPEHILN